MNMYAVTSVRCNLYEYVNECVSSILYAGSGTGVRRSKIMYFCSYLCFVSLPATHEVRITLHSTSTTIAYRQIRDTDTPLESVVCEIVNVIRLTSLTLCALSGWPNIQ
jgi:hypothetical protein